MRARGLQTGWTCTNNAVVFVSAEVQARKEHRHAVLRREEVAELERVASVLVEKSGGLFDVGAMLVRPKLENQLLQKEEGAAMVGALS
eukprot:CAMPEP_0175837442 /NCGR_PEP_ID=MMETSP0107_2-20121207/17697_1 /TAXON_ID=195067 ORGANISM="Goniomonas pacifica, Strain CCMP1869" /NCGR_SAMPLE_ID=MMETSP0107_2 /ASSEMBLY_ACC=CAM_ASM_000203 /LENGTH=87 /DNA_ID=CAMNT_0017150941 /DNA_START=810 /DNA_END=1070 /DNA_ORIENTATION=-